MEQKKDLKIETNQIFSLKSSYSRIINLKHLSNTASENFKS